VKSTFLIVYFPLITRLIIKINKIHWIAPRIPLYC